MQAPSLGGRCATLRELIATDRLASLRSRVADVPDASSPWPAWSSCRPARSRQDHLHRAELPLARRRGWDRPARGADVLRQVPQRPRRSRRNRATARCERQGRLRGRGRLRHRPALQRCPLEEALEAIAGYMLLNDLSAWDLQFATPQWMPGKVFDGSAPSGLALVTPDEAGAPDEISFALDLNGERMQEASTADLIFSVPELVSRLSRWMTLEPGDIVSTGTPAGWGAFASRGSGSWLGTRSWSARRRSASSGRRLPDREEPIISRAWIKAALVVLIGGRSAWVHTCSRRTRDRPPRPSRGRSRRAGSRRHDHEPHRDDARGHDGWSRARPPDSDPFTSAACWRRSRRSATQSAPGSS